MEFSGAACLCTNDDAFIGALSVFIIFTKLRDNAALFVNELSFDDKLDESRLVLRLDKNRSLSSTSLSSTPNEFEFFRKDSTALNIRISTSSSPSSFSRKSLFVRRMESPSRLSTSAICATISTDPRRFSLVWEVGVGGNPVRMLK
eukprot:CAMPEP_0201655358 /NCGR_PEP_ID=MMETSP0493-20130528/45972_1 /ASSEMBLY_ACC=CAM_ASM_000838 /TAXON_ID=420259 /ORGANISM="Thalassiosira gravida, Strain GMp14c1" /LENGTH=145 /DNA_ID=CAMNT_0048131941 /DNA_START=700 /DNA_END=1137 /DNA_ORIENTATION=+